MKNLISTPGYLPRLLVVFVMCIVNCTSSFALAISGVTTVCPGYTYTYSVAGINSINETRYYLLENGVITKQGALSSSNNTFTVQYTRQVTSAELKIISYFPNSSSGAIVEQTSRNVLKRIPVPNPISSVDGKVILCYGGDEVPVTSLPELGNNVDDCNFHCPVEWSAPMGWNLSYKHSTTGNPLYSDFSNTSLIAPYGLSRGFAGSVAVTAYWIECGYTQNTSRSRAIWYGTGDIINPTVDNAPAQNNNYVSNSSSFLRVETNGATDFSWSIVGGNGMIYQTSGDYCQIYVDGFIRVQAQALNRCGTGDTFTFTVTLQSSRAYTVSPNPAKDEVNVDFESKDFASKEVTALDLLNEKGKVVKSFDINRAKSTKYFDDKKTVKLNVGDLPRGTYFLHVTYGDTVDKKQVVLD